MSSFTNAGLVLPEFKIKLKVVASAFVFSGIETVLPLIKLPLKTTPSVIPRQLFLDSLHF
jgi:hypothetical protein